MTIADAHLSMVPDPLPLVGEGRLKAVTGGVHRHVYAATGRTTIDVPLAGPAEVDVAVAAARTAARGWRAAPIQKRRRLLLSLADAVRAHAEELTAIQTVENGVPHRAAVGFVHGLNDALQYNAGWTDKITGSVNPAWPAAGLDYSVLEPYGVVAVIIPWNSPLYCLGTVVGPALAAGNCVVVKPPELTPFSSLRFAELALDVGFPPGVVNVIPGDGTAGAALVAHPGIDKIHFTGSGPTAARILQAAAANLTPVATELGGKSANVIFSDADLDAAVARSVGFCMQVSGQGCINGTRILVEDSVHDEVVDRIRQAAAAFAPGDPVSPSTIYGPVISDAALTRILGFVDRAKQQGAGTLVTGGSRVGGEFAGGYYVEPTVFADVDPGAEIARKEIFGPVLSVVRFTDEADAVAKANETDYGLGSYVQTADLGRAHRMAAALDAGMVWVNGMSLPPSIPFGGVKQSGTGRLGGLAAIQEFSRTKNVWITL